MRHFLTVLAALYFLAAPAAAQIVKSLSYNTTNDTIVQTQRIVFPRLGFGTGTASAPSVVYTVGTNSLGTYAATQIGIGPHLAFSVDGARRFFIATNQVRAELPISFANTNDAATTRTNLGLGAAWLTNTNVTSFRSSIGLERIWAYKATNQTNATTNLVSDSALTFTASANTRYAVEVFLVAPASVSPLQARINTATNVTAFGTWTEYDAASQFAWLAGNAVTNRATVVSFDGNAVSVWQRFVVVGATNTNAAVTFQFAPGDTNGNAVIEAGSYLKAEVIE